MPRFVTPTCADGSATFSRTCARSMSLNHLQALEAESLHIFREVVAQTEQPVLLYSIGKDSSVLLHLARKAFAPAPLPFPLLHIDTGWKFREMIAFRDATAERYGLELRVHTNPRGAAEQISPLTHGSGIHTDVMKTEALRQALDAGRYDAAFGGARRDEEASRAKERIISHRTANHRWDPRLQRPELWQQYNLRHAKGECLRVFPLSNWTERDVWDYIAQEGIDVVPLYFAAVRPVVARGGTWIMRDDDRLRLAEGETLVQRRVRFRTLGCYPLTGAIDSEADSLQAILEEMRLSRRSEREGRLIDQDGAGAMERKKQEGYF
ncbi:MAG: sulfate adenylyltransferase subunit CysD [Xanthomonadales bacterium]|nr:sulfate adenylyltransferase subunit CysD [Xanthomonadales bacterium]